MCTANAFGKSGVGWAFPSPIKSRARPDCSPRQFRYGRWRGLRPGGRTAIRGYGPPGSGRTSSPPPTRDDDWNIPRRIGPTRRPQTETDHFGWEPAPGGGWERSDPGACGWGISRVHSWEAVKRTIRPSTLRKYRRQRPAGESRSGCSGRRRDPVSHRLMASASSRRLARRRNRAPPPVHSVRCRDYW